MDEKAARGTNAGPESGPIGVRCTAPPAGVGRAIERTSARYVADFASLYGRIAGETGELYEAQIAAKNEALAAKDEVIAAQRDLIDHQQESLADLREQLCQLREVLASEPEPASVIVAGDAAPRPFPPAPRAWWRRLFGGE